MPKGTGRTSGDLQIVSEFILVLRATANKLHNYWYTYLITISWFKISKIDRSSLKKCGCDILEKTTWKLLNIKFDIMLEETFTFKGVSKILLIHKTTLP